MKRDSNIIRLNSNENPLGASVQARMAAQELLQHAHLYPDSQYHELKNTLAQYYSLAADQITLGNGSENVLELIIKSYLHQDESAIISAYTFHTISMLLKHHRIKAKIIPLREWHDDIQGMIQAIDDTTRMLFLVNPGNPTGSYISQKDFMTLMQSVPADVLVVVDEAYAEYMSSCTDYPDTISCLSQFPNLIITRTFSKIHGLAALRVGYALSSREIASQLDCHRLPYNVNALAAIAASAALRDDAHIKKSIAVNDAGRKQLLTGLQSFPLEILPSSANFLTVKVEDAMQTYQTLLREGVMVFPLNAYGLPQHVRISIGTEQQNECLLEAVYGSRFS